MISALLACALALAAALPAQANNGTMGEELDEEGDSAPFVITVEHSDGRRCGGSLVSLRTALTSAACARGARGTAPRQLTALAAAPSPPAPPAPPGAPPAEPHARRVARVALPAGAEPAPDAEPWAAAALDVALLELEAPFDASSRTRPILMATDVDECAAPASCHVVRALGRAELLRIVDVALVSAEACAARADGWATLNDFALCLEGPELCSGDWGAGIVCGGKLCGVVSRSVPGAEPKDGDVTGVGCGDTHAAQNVARWRRFLRCAHTLGACGSGDCSQLCSEQRLLEPEPDGDEETPGSPEPPGYVTVAQPPSRTAVTVTIETTRSTLPPKQSETMLAPATTTGARPVSRTLAPRTTAPRSPASRSTRQNTAGPPATATQARGLSRGNEFEPNRPDFKAGEYGDNAADYGDDDAPPPSTAAPTTAQPPPPATPPSSPRSPPPGRRRALTAGAPRAAALRVLSFMAIVFSFAR